MKGRRDIMGRIISVTSELATAVKAEAKLFGLIQYTGLGAEIADIHQTNGNFKHIVSQSKVGESSPKSAGTLAEFVIAFCPDILVIWCCFVVELFEAWHRDRSDEVALSTHLDDGVAISNFMRV